MSPATLTGLQNMQNLQSKFAQADTNNDGNITKNELVNTLKKDGLKEADADKIINAIDKDKDGQLSKTEQVSFQIKALQERVAQVQSGNTSLMQQIFQGKASPLSADNTDPNNAVPNTIGSLLDVLKDANQSVNDDLTTKMQKLMTEFKDGKIDKDELQKQALALVNKEIPEVNTQA